MPKKVDPPSKYILYDFIFIKLWKNASRFLVIESRSVVVWWSVSGVTEGHEET